MRNLSLVKSLSFVLILLEIIGFIVVGNLIGIFATILLIVITTALGLFILRTQGFITLINMQRGIQNGEHPAVDIFEGALMMFGGFLLLIPGFITDICGLLLLVPPVRWFVMGWLIKANAVKVSSPTSSAYKVRGNIIEGEWHREDHEGK